MAYPFSRTPSGLRTPEALKGFETESSPRSPKHPSEVRSKPIPSQYVRILAIFAVACCFVLLCFNTGDKLLSSTKQPDRIPLMRDANEDSLAHFAGAELCGLDLPALYLPPQGPFSKHDSSRSTDSYCPNRATLLSALGSGGRHGFGAPYHPAGCHYRWYSSAEICLILDRFAALVFIGDDMVRLVYAGLNMLLREDITFGALRSWETKSREEMERCFCERQLTEEKCKRYGITSSAEVREARDGKRHGRGYYCDRTAHTFIPTATSPSPAAVQATFQEILSVPRPYPPKPLPVIFSVSSASTYTVPLATSFVDEWLAIAEPSGPNIPFLWLGPPAAGYDLREDMILVEGNDARWRYSLEMDNQTRTRGIESLGMWNLTVQAGKRGLELSLVQAMMVINWLSRLEST